MRVSVLALMLVTVGLSGLASTEAGPATSIDRQGAVDWALDASWGPSGLAVDFPGHVVFPETSDRTLRALENLDEGDRVEGVEAARAAARLQQPSGGFIAFEGAFFPPTTAVTASAVAMADRYDVEINEETAAHWLSQRQNEDGGFAPGTNLAGENHASRTDATYHALRGLLSLDALGPDQRLDALSYLHETHQLGSGWKLSASDPGPRVSGTFFALAALDQLDALDPATGLQAALFLQEREVDGGGYHEHPAPFGEGEREPPTSTSTAQALLAHELAGPLAHVLVPPSEDHAGWLSDLQHDQGPLEGAFTLYHDRGTPITNWARNTALALMALDAKGELDRVDEEAAVTYLADTQHEGTGGFAWRPLDHGELVTTAAAVHALDLLGEGQAWPAAGLSTTLSELQTSTGAIQRPWWDLGERMEQTAYGLQAAATIDALGNLDVDAAVAFVASHQDATGGFEDRHEFVATLSSTNLAVTTLASLDRLDAIDADAAAAFIADQQEADGRISMAPSGDFAASWETRQSIDALLALGALDRVDVDAAASYLASWQRPDGTFREEATGAHVVSGLVAIDRLDAVDADAATTFLLEQQRDDGGFTDGGFPPGPSPMERHALVLEALTDLGAL